MEPPICITTDHFINKEVVKCFSTGCGGYIQNVNEVVPNNVSVATYGILRGTDKLIKSSKNFFYIDRGYFGAGKANCEGYFRITKDAIIHSGSGNHSWDRFEKFEYKLKPWKKDGKYIIVIPPNKPMAKFLSIEDWIDKTIIDLLKATDRDILISRKKQAPTTNPPLISKIEEKIPQIKSTEASFDQHLSEAWAVITDHSNCMTKSLIEGVPVVCTNKNRKIGSIEEIERPIYDREILKNLAYNQWTLKEMSDGKAWEEINT